MDGLALDNVCKLFGAFPVLQNVSCRFSQVEIVGLVGPNGAGKSTLIDVVTGFLKPKLGHVMFRSIDLAGLAPHAIARMGIMRTFQFPRLAWQLTVIENLVLAADPNSGSYLAKDFLRSGGGILPLVSDKVNSALIWTGLEGMKNAIAADLSYGQQKLLSLACCVVVAPAILLLDEPIAGIDVGARERIRNIIVSQKAAGVTVVIVEHDLEFVCTIADRILGMSSGTIVFDCPARDPAVGDRLGSLFI